MASRGRWSLLDQEQVRASAYEVGELPETVEPRIEVRLDLAQVAAEGAQVRPARLVGGLLQGLKEKVARKRWRIERRLPVTRFGRGGGVDRHRAVVAQVIRDDARLTGLGEGGGAGRSTSVKMNR